jgi:hypothetical protein
MPAVMMKADKWNHEATLIATVLLMSFLMSTTCPTAGNQPTSFSNPYCST